MNRLLKLIILLSILLNCYSPFVITALSEPAESWYWPLWRKEGGKEEPVTYLSRGYSDKHHALDIAPFFDDEIVEVRATKDGTVTALYYGCANEDGYYNGPCSDADKGCEPVKELLTGFDSSGLPIIEITEKHYHDSGYLAGYCNSGLGNFICITHDDGSGSLYGHLESITIETGDTVKQGDVIGYAGSTGYSTGRHLHFAIFPNQDDLLSRTNSLNNNPSSPSFMITLADDEVMAMNNEGYVYDKEGIDYIFTIEPDEKKVTLKEEAITLKPEETYQIKPQGFSIKECQFTSRNEKIAYVDKNGLIKAVFPGSTVITVSCGNSEAFLNVTVMADDPPAERNLLQTVLDFLFSLFH